MTTPTTSSVQNTSNQLRLPPSSMLPLPTSPSTPQPPSLPLPSAPSMFYRISKDELCQNNSLSLPLRPLTYEECQQYAPLSWTGRTPNEAGCQIWNNRKEEDIEYAQATLLALLYTPCAADFCVCTTTGAFPFPFPSPPPLPSLPPPPPLPSLPPPPSLPPSPPPSLPPSPPPSLPPSPPPSSPFSSPSHNTLGLAFIIFCFGSSTVGIIAAISFSCLLGKYRTLRSTLQSSAARVQALESLQINNSNDLGKLSHNGLTKSQIEDCPDALRCGITTFLIKNPVNNSQGHAFEKTAIEQWMENHTTCPISSIQTSKQMYPNMIMRHNLREYIEKCKQENSKYYHLIQAHAKRYLTQKRVKNIRFTPAATKLQKVMRGKLTRNGLRKNINVKHPSNPSSSEQPVEVTSTTQIRPELNTHSQIQVANLQRPSFRELSVRLIQRLRRTAPPPHQPPAESAVELASIGVT